MKSIYYYLDYPLKNILNLILTIYILYLGSINYNNKSSVELINYISV